MVEVMGDVKDELTARSAAVTVFPTPGVPVTRILGRFLFGSSLSLIVDVLLACIDPGYETEGSGQLHRDRVREGRSGRGLRRPDVLIETMLSNVTLYVHCQSLVCSHKPDDIFRLIFLKAKSNCRQ